MYPILSDIEFFWIFDKLHVQDFHLAPLFGVTTAHLNERLSRRMENKGKSLVRMMSQDDGLVRRPGGRVRPIALYDGERMEILLWNERIHASMKAEFNAIKYLCNLFRLPASMDGVYRLLKTLRSNSNQSNIHPIPYARGMGCPYLSKGGKLKVELPSGLIAIDNGCAVAITVDRLSIIIPSTLPISKMKELQNAMAVACRNKEIKTEYRGHPIKTLRTTSPYSDMIPYAGGVIALRLDFNPAKMSLEYALCPLECFSISLKRLGTALPQEAHLSRIDIAVDYPCAAGIPFLLSPASFRPPHSRVPVLKGKPPFQTTVYGRNHSDKAIKLYDKSAEIEARGKAPKRKTEEYLASDVFRFESLRRGKLACFCMDTNPFESLPFPKIHLAGGAMLPSPAKVYQKHFPELWKAFSSRLAFELQKALAQQCTCTSQPERGQFLFKVQKPQGYSFIRQTKPQSNKTDFQQRNEVKMAGFQFRKINKESGMQKKMVEEPHAQKPLDPPIPPKTSGIPIRRKHKLYAPPTREIKTAYRNCHRPSRSEGSTACQERY